MLVLLHIASNSCLERVCAAAIDGCDKAAINNVDPTQIPVAAIGTAISKHWPGLSTITWLIQATSAEETLDCDRSDWSALSDDRGNRLAIQYADTATPVCLSRGRAGDTRIFDVRAAIKNSIHSSGPISLG